MKPLYRVSGPTCIPLQNPDFPKRGSGVQPADRSLFPGKGSPLAKGWVLLGVSRALAIAGPFLFLGGADKAWCQARGLNWAALCQAHKLRGELLELMQRIELPLSQPAFGSEQNRRDLQKALVSGYFLKVRGKSWGEGHKRSKT